MTMEELAMVLKKDYAEPGKKYARRSSREKRLSDKCIP